MTASPAIRSFKRLTALALTGLITAIAFAAVASPAQAGTGGPWYLSGGGYLRANSAVTNHSADIGLLTSTFSHRVTVRDRKADTLGACVTVYVDKSGDGQGWKDPKTVCDPDGAAGSQSGTMWYSFKVATAWQTGKLKIVTKAGSSYTRTDYAS